MRVISPRYLESQWPLSGVVLGETVSSYPTRSVVPFESDQGSFAVKVDQESDSHGLQQGAAVLTFLERQGFLHAPTVLPARDGELVQGSSTFRASVLERAPLPAIDPDEPFTSWREVGKAVGKLNSIEGYQHPFAVGTRDALREVELSIPNLASDREAQVILTRLEAIGQFPDTGMVHGEVNPSNMARRQDGTLVLLDWDQAGTGAPIIDQGYPLILNFVSVDDLSFDTESAAAFYGGYLAGGGTIHEPDDIFSAALLHACRYARFADQDKRVRRILHAIEHEQELCEALTFA